jgi:hypothetical protein
MMGYDRGMSEISTPDDRDEHGRFLAGHKGGGRPKGARDRHSRNFLNAFADDFEKHGPATIAKVREERPDAYLRIAADLLPKTAEIDVDVNVLHEVSSALEAFRVLAELTGADPTQGMRRLRQLAPQIEHDGFEE